MKKIGYVVWFNILFLSFVCTDLINETEWLEDTLYGVTWITLLFVVIYYKKYNFDKIILLIVELILLSRKKLVECVWAVGFGNEYSTERIVWSIIAVLLFVLLAILIIYILRKRDERSEFAASIEGEGESENKGRDEEGTRNDKGAWIMGILLFSVSGYIIYLYQSIYLGKIFDISIHEDAIINLINALVQYVLFIGGMLIVIWVIVNTVDTFLLDRRKRKNEKGLGEETEVDSNTEEDSNTKRDQKIEKDQKAKESQKAENPEEMVELTRRIFLLSLYIMLLIGFLEYKQILSVDTVINVLSNNASGIISVVLVFLYVGIVMIVSLVIAIFVKLRNTIKDSFYELAENVLRKCKKTLQNVVNFIAFITVDLFSAVIDLLVGESDDELSDREGKKGDPSGEVMPEKNLKELSEPDTESEEQE